MSVLAVVLIACAVLIVLGAEWPRLSARGKSDVRPKRRERERERRKAQLRVIHGDRDDFAESVQRDLDRLPVTEEHDDPRSPRR